MTENSEAMDSTASNIAVEQTKKKPSKKVYLLLGLAITFILCIICTIAATFGYTITIQKAKDNAKNANTTFNIYTNSIDDALSHFEETPKSDKASLEKYCSDGKSVIDKYNESLNKLETAIKNLQTGSYKDSLNSYLNEAKSDIKIEQENVRLCDEQNGAVIDYYQVNVDYGAIRQVIYTDPEKYTSEVEKNIVPKTEGVIATFEKSKSEDSDLQKITDINVKLMKETLNYFKVSAAAVKEKNSVKLANATSDFSKNYTLLSEEYTTQADIIKEKVIKNKNVLKDLKEKSNKEFDKIK